MQTLGIDRLTISERIGLVHEILDSIAAETENAPLTEAERQEVDRRLLAHKANPGAAIPWEQIDTEAIARLTR